MSLTLMFVWFMHVVNGKETIGLFCFLIEPENVTFTEEQLFEILKMNGYNVTRIVHTNEDEIAH